MKISKFSTGIVGTGDEAMFVKKMGWAFDEKSEICCCRFTGDGEK